MARIIKADRAAGTVMPAKVVSAGERARAIIARAEATADAIVKDARVHASQIEVRARQAAEAQARAELASEHVQLAQARVTHLKDAETQLAKLALVASKELLGRQLKLDPDAIAEVVAPLLAKLRRAQRVTLHVHPEDMAPLQAWLAGTAADGAVRVAQDGALDRGGVRIDSNLGQLDASVETRLAALARAWQVPYDD